MLNLQIGDNDIVGNKFNGHDLHLYLRENGVESNHLVGKKYSNDVYTSAEENSVGVNFAEKILYSKYFAEADIIHLHLIHNTDFNLNYLPIMTKLKPTVITLHEPYFLGGHCTYHLDCEKWKTHCFDCPNLNIPFPLTFDKTALDFEQKKLAIQNSDISAIVASKWMEDKVKQSPIWKDKKVYRIPFGINQEIFKPVNKIEAKKNLGIDADSITLMFRSQQHEYKGFDIIKGALRKIESHKKITLITVFQTNLLDDFKDKFSIIEYDWINDDNLLSQLYQASDLFLMPSSQEAFGMMAIEAFSCGTPVLATKGTALEEVINAPECGITVEHNVEAFAKELQRLIDNPNELKERGLKSLDFAKANYNKDIYVKRIIEVYNEVINNHKTDESIDLVLNQLIKHWTVKEIKEEIIEHPKLTAKELKEEIIEHPKRTVNRPWFLFYKLVLRSLIILIWGKKKVKEKYDVRFL